MNGLVFSVQNASAERFAATPTLNLRVRIDAPAGVQIESIALRAQVRIEPQRRSYAEVEARRLLELYGETPRWGDTLKPFLWTHVSVHVPSLAGRAEIDMPIPCTYDMDVAAAKYFHALEGGEVPLVLLFSGSIFTRGAAGLDVSPVPWNCEASFRLPVAVWREVMEIYFPGSGWLRLRRETLDALLEYKGASALPTWDEVMASLLRAAAGEESSREKSRTMSPAPAAASRDEPAAGPPSTETS